MSDLPTHLEGYGENVCAMNGPIVRQVMMQNTEFKEEILERSRKISALHPSSFGVNSEF